MTCHTRTGRLFLFNSSNRKNYLVQSNYYCIVFKISRRYVSNVSTVDMLWSTRRLVFCCSLPGINLGKKKMYSISELTVGFKLLHQRQKKIPYNIPYFSNRTLIFIDLSYFSLFAITVFCTRTTIEYRRGLAFYARVGQTRAFVMTQNTRGVFKK